MEIITSVENRKIKMYASLNNSKYRKQYGLFLVEEVHMIQEALKANLLDTLIIRENCENIFDFENVIHVSDAVMKKISDNVSLNSYVGVVKVKQYSFNSDCKKTVILENVQDPGNVGTIIRTAHSFGYENIILSNDCADLYNSKTVKSTQGALFYSNILRMDINEALQLCRDNGYYITATALNDSVEMKKSVVSDRTALVFGNEGKGLKPQTVQMCDQSVRIEMDGFDSLNVAVAAGICMYYFK